MVMTMREGGDDLKDRLEGLERIREGLACM